jgi:hypothetical protein
MIISVNVQLVICHNGTPCPNHFRTHFVRNAATREQHERWRWGSMVVADMDRTHGVVALCKPPGEVVMRRCDVAAAVGPDGVDTTAVCTR